MRTYREWAPSPLDTRGLGLDDRQDWLVVPVSRTRDSVPLDESNFACALAMLGGESDTVEVHRFGHWACGWIEIVIVQPGTDAERVATDIEASLADYPILDESDFSEREQAAADDVWRTCYTDAGRLDYIREHRSQFEFRSMADMIACVRGRYFAGYASELLG